MIKIKRLTQRAPDGWESPRFQAGFWLEAGSGKMVLSHPAHPRVTQTVGRARKLGNVRNDMKVLYCRYCHKDVPMLDENEYAQVLRVHMACLETAKQYRQQHNATFAETPREELYRPVQELIQEITHSTDFDIEEVLQRHRISRWRKTE
jgi:hypothetical protein